MRAIWKGYLKHSLVTMPVKRYPASSKKPLKFHLYHDRCGSRRGAGSHHEQTPRVHFRAAFFRLVR